MKVSQIYSEKSKAEFLVL